MKAIILAGGLGPRFGDLLGCLPKSMAPVNGKSLLEIALHGITTRSTRGGRF